MDDKVWKDVKGYEGRYQVSNTGKVKSLERYVKNGVNKYKLHKERLLKPIQYRDGYLGYGLRKDSKSTDHHSNSKAHWLVMNAFGEPKPEWATMINHIDGDKTNNYIDNLEWSNVQLNNKHYNEVLRPKKNIQPNSTKWKPVIAYKDESPEAFTIFHSSIPCADHLDRARQVLYKALKYGHKCNGHRVYHP